MKVLAIILATLFVVGIIYFTATPAGVAAWNNWWHGVQEADDDTNYETLKHVEDRKGAEMVVMVPSKHDRIGSSMPGK